MVLYIQAGDIINIISKPPMGIWTGMLNNKVGNFKFIYVDVLVDKEEEEEVPKIRQQKLCKRPRPKTLLELLERLNLEVRTGSTHLGSLACFFSLIKSQESFQTVTIITGKQLKEHAVVSSVWHAP